MVGRKGIDAVERDKLARERESLPSKGTNVWSKGNRVICKINQSSHVKMTLDRVLGVEI